jgi:hypothetical protein
MVKYARPDKLFLTWVASDPPLADRGDTPSVLAERGGRVSLCPVFRCSLLTQADVLKAARVRVSFEHHDKLGMGSYSLDGMMIDAPVYKQVSGKSFHRVGLTYPGVEGASQGGSGRVARPKHQREGHICLRHGMSS